MNAEKLSPKETKVVSVSPQVLAARFSPCGQFLIGGGFDALVRRWDASSTEFPELPPLSGHQGWVGSVAFSSAAKLLFSADSWGALRAWQYAGEPVTLAWSLEQAHDGWIRELHVSPDGSLLASCGMDRRVRVRDTASGEQRHEFAGHGRDVQCVRFHPDGKSLVSGDDFGVLKQWDLATGNCVREFDARSLYMLHRLQDVGGAKVLAFNREGTWLACGGTTPKGGGTVQGSPTILIFEVATGKLLHTLVLGSPNDCYVHDVTLHDDGFVMAVTSGTPGSGKLLFQRPGEAEPFFVTTAMANCHSLSWDPERRRLAVVATNKGSNGNGRQLNKDGEYPDNSSPIHIFEWEG